MALPRNRSRLNRWLRKSLRHFIKAKAGVTMIEFGILAPPFFLVLIAILETVMASLAGQLLQTAIEDTSRLILTGRVQQNGLTQEEYRQLVCDQLLGLFDCSGLHIEVKTIDKFATASLSPVPIDATCQDQCDWNRPEIYDPGKHDHIVSIQAYYQWPMLTGFSALTHNLAPNGKKILAASTLFRNEPFPL